MKRLGVVLFLILLTTGFALAAPKTAADYFAMGAQLYSVKDYQGAAYSYEAGLVLDPNNAGSYQSLGDAYYFLGRQTDAMTAYQKSLALNPKNLKLAEYVKTFKPQDATGNETEITMFSKMQATPVIDYSTVNSQAATISSKPEVKFVMGKGTWVRFYGGYDFALLNDLNTGITSSQTLLDSNPNSVTAATANTGSNGFMAGAEFGLLLDPGNGLSISCENVWTQNLGYDSGLQSVTVNNGMTLAPQSASFNPSMLDISLNYYAYLPGGKGTRTYFTVGGGYYQAFVNFAGVDPTLSNPSESGTFTGTAVGWKFGFGETLAIGNSFGLEFSARGRIVTFAEMSTQTLTNQPSPPSGSAYAVVINNYGANLGSIYVTSTNNIGGYSYRYAVLDYTGFDADLSFDFYF
jgi:tetratricopeptide (TPR) repeat protein